MTLPWYDETDLPDWDGEWDEDEFVDDYNPDYNPDDAGWFWRSMVTVELPPMPGEEQP